VAAPQRADQIGMPCCDLRGQPFVQRRIAPTDEGNEPSAAQHFGAKLGG